MEVVTKQKSKEIDLIRSLFHLNQRESEMSCVRNTKVNMFHKKVG